MSDAIKALVKAQQAMGKAVKNAKNPHLKSSYADLGSVMEACFSALHDNGFAVMQPGGADEHGPFVETVFAHESGEAFRSKCYLVIGKQDMQGVGSAWTYARRYGLLGMAGLAPEDDDGEATKAPKRPPQEAIRQPETTAPDYQAIHDRLMAGIAKRKTKQLLTQFWTDEAEARMTLKANATGLYNLFFAAFEEAGKKAHDDKAGQAQDPGEKAA